MIPTFLLDQGLPRSACLTLRQWGITALHVADLNMAAATDAEILAYARQNRRVVVTLDADFHQLLPLAKARDPSVIRIRLEGMKGHQLATILRDLSDQAAGEIESGCVVTIDPLGARIHRLPIGIG